MWSPTPCLLVSLFLGALACGASEKQSSGVPAPVDTADSAAPVDTAGEDDSAAPAGPGPFADAVVSYLPGPGAGYGQDKFPDVVYGPPEGGGEQGSLDVLSLGVGGEIVLEFTDIGLVDGPGPDLLVFENPFPGWYEPGAVAVSADGADWKEWPCDPAAADSNYPGCAGVALVYASTASGLDPTDPAVAGGDAFDLADLGLAAARFVRIRDGGLGSADGLSAGFDLDALAVVNGEALSP